MEYYFKSSTDDSDSEKQRKALAFSNSGQAYDSPYDDGYMYQELIPAKDKVGLKSSITNELDQSSCAIISNFLLRLACVFLLVYVFTVVFLAIPKTASTLGCTYIEVENGTNCNNSYARYFAMNRILLSVVLIPVVVYCVSGAGPSVIGFAMAQEIPKWRGIAAFLTLYEFRGLLNTILFFLFAYATPALFHENLSDVSAAIEIPSLFTNPLCFMLFFWLYIVLLLIRGDVLAEFTFEKEKRFEPKDGESVIRAMNILISLLFGLIISMFFIGMVLVLGFNMNMKSPLLIISRYAVISFLLIKYIILVRKITKSIKIIYPHYNVYALELYFLISMYFEVWDSDNEIFKPVFIIMYTMYGCLAVLVFINNFFMWGLIKHFFGVLRDHVVKILLGGAGLVEIITTASSLTIITPFLDIINKLNAGMNETGESGFDLKLCSSLYQSENAKKVLGGFYPSEMLLKFAAFVSYSLNFEMKIFGVVIIMIVLFLFRFEGDEGKFKKGLVIAILYQIFCIIRMDGINDSLLSSRNFGYAQMSPHDSAINSSVENFIILQLYLLILAASCGTLHNRKNETKMDVSKETKSIKSDQTINTSIGNMNAPEKAVPKTFFCSRLITYLLLLPLMICLMFSFKQRWMSTSPTDMTYYHSDYKLTDNDPTEIFEGSQCSAGLPDSASAAYADNLAQVTANHNIFFEDKRHLAYMTEYPFSVFDDKIGFLIPSLIAISLVLFGSLADERHSRILNETLSSILIIVMFFNFIVFIETYFLTYTTAMQYPVLFIDVVMEDGFFWTLATFMITLIILAMHLIDSVAVIAAPIEYKTD